MARLTKPASIRSDPWRSKRWDEVVRGRDFTREDAPTIALLVQWYQVVDQCMEDLGAAGGVTLTFENKVGDVKAMPQLTTMKQASAEIRALNRQLGIDDTHAGGGGADGAGDGYLRLIQGRRADRRASTG